VPYYQHKTATDTLTLPAVIYPNDTSITVGVKGQSSQSGTPSPSNPVDVNGVGERTGNLWDEDYTDISSSIKYKAVYVGNGEFTLSTQTPIYGGATAMLFFLAGDVSSGASGDNKVYEDNPKTVTSINGYVTIAYRTVYNINPQDYSTMLNSGSTALPYEPYGIKIPILSGGTTTPVYLGEVQTVRQIKKYEITGTEGWTLRFGTPENVFFCERQDVNYINNAAICSHYANQDSGSFDDLQDKHFIVRIASSGDKTYFTIRDSSYPSTNEGIFQLRSYLQQQYSNGTPVTIYYVLATPTTGITNEPLMEIGTYADSLTTSIPCTAGENTLDVQTTVQPSEVSAGFSGWHPVQSVHERSGGAWD
jgi:hypothetical protein